LNRLLSGWRADRWCCTCTSTSAGGRIFAFISILVAAVDLGRAVDLIIDLIIGRFVIRICQIAAGFS